MLSRDKITKYAEVLLWALKLARKERFKKKDIILIQYDLPALKLAEEIYGRVLDLGMNPVPRAISSHTMERTFYEKGNPQQITFIPPGDRELFEKINGRIFLRAPESLTHLQNVDSGKIGKMLVSRKPLRTILDKREDEGDYSWTLCLYPTAELAQQARATAEDYTGQVIKACYLDFDDPVGKWQEIYGQAAHIKKRLNSLKIHTLHIESPSFDLRVTPGDRRKWVGISGHNIPSFEIFLSPDWRGTEGSYYANLPSYRTGNYVEEVRLTFEKGRVVGVEAGKAREFVAKQLAMDAGASRVGEFSLTDRRFSRIDRFMADTLFDENFGGPSGNCHLAVGSSYSGTYSGNPAELTKEAKRKLGFNDSALHWDLVNTEDKTVTAHLEDGKRMTIYQKGIFTL